MRENEKENEKPKKRPYRYSAAIPKPQVFERRCNRCYRIYKGTGRLLCPFCRQYADQCSPMAEGFDL